MAIELVAGRLISRYLGQSLYTWTTIIGVVLAGISLGNYLGGRLADRSSGRGTLGIQFLLAGAGCLSVLAANAWTGQWPVLADLSWPVRIFGHVTLVFLVPAALLGTISPVIAKRALNLGIAEGRTIGNVYAWATGGSILGTFLTGFYLLTWMGATRVMAVAAAGLAGIGVVYGIGALLPRVRESASRIGATAASQTTGSATISARPALRDWLIPIGTVFIASACVMIVEIVAGRIVSRYYGQSLYSWTAVIGGVLAGMTLGSFIGGRAADRFSTGKTLCALFVLASVGCQCIPIVSNVFTDQFVLVRFSWPMQIAIHVTAVFLAPALLLGAITPVVVKAALAQGRGAGRTVGGIYAWGSVGSILGTFLAGYWLIAALGTVMVLRVVAAALAAVAVAYGRKSTLAYAWAGACAVAVVLAAAPWQGTQQVGRTLALRDAGPPGAVYVDESQYSYIAIVADPNHPNIREMALDRLVHSRVDLDNPRDLRYEYEWVYAAVIDKYYPEGRPMTAMVIGGGGYAFPHYLELTRPGSYVSVAEIDPAVTEAAHAAFGLPRDTTIDIYNKDARNYVDDALRRQRIRGAAKFDCIFGDSINDYSVPYHLTTREFNDRLSALLAGDGLYLFNLIDMLGSGRFLGAVLNTCRQTFPYVYVFSAFDDPGTRDTFVVVNSKRLLDLADLPDTLRARHSYRGSILTQAQLDGLRDRSQDLVLTDDFAPVDNMLAPVVRTSQASLPASLINAANAALGDGRVDDAIRNARMVLRSGLLTAEAREILGSALTKQGDLDGAVAELRKSIEANPNRETAYNNLASALFQQGDEPGAIEALNTAIRINPNFIEAYKNLAFALLNQGKADEAMEKCQVVLRSGTYPAEANEITGLALMRKGDWDGAIASFRKSLEAQPNRESAWNDLGHALFKNGDRNGAVDTWKSLVQSLPESAVGHESLGSALVQQGDADGAISHLQKALELNPQSVSARNNLAVALFQKGDVAGAIRELHALLAVNPAYPGVPEQLAVAYWKIRDYDNAWKQVNAVRAAGRTMDPNFLEALKRSSGREQ